MRIALANLPYPSSPDDSVARVTAAIADAGRASAALACFPECYVPGYRGLGHVPPPPDAAFLDRAWRTVAEAAAAARVAVVLGTERIGGLPAASAVGGGKGEVRARERAGKPDQEDGALRATALVLDAAGRRLGFQDKVQLDPSEDTTYHPGTDRHLFRAGELAFGVAICHEGWRYPETVRWAARHGAHVVFHPHYHPAEPGGYRPTTFADPANTFHEKAMLCRAAENTCYFASVNYASPGSATTSAIANPDGTVLAWQPYGEAGLLVADLDLARATRLLATRLRS